ncbi:MAG: sensor histidine kinase [Janthinobacterium lividum]
MPKRLPVEPAALASIETFQGLPAEVLAWLQQVGELRQYTDNELIAAAGTVADELVAVVRGSVYYTIPRSGQADLGFRLDASQVGGVLPYSRLQCYPGQAVAVGDTVLYLLSRSHFARLEQLSPELVQQLIAAMNDRARAEVRAQGRDDKLRALGKLSAGLSHELNNPAAAISRAAALLTTSLQVIPHLLVGLLATGLMAEGVAVVTALAVLPAAAAPTLPALQAADQEDELADWLATQGCPDGYALAAGLLGADLTVAALTPVAAQLPTGARPAAFAWLSGHLTAARLARDISEASRRISTLVGDVKTYSHMDRAAGREKLAVTSGLDSTLNMFAYALRQKNVRLSRDYAPDLPLIMGQAGSLNQVWTNLIDNALDALPDRGGELTVRTWQQAGCVWVGIRDNGSGMTPEVLAHQFEPFFTTKPPGEGTGQGLDIARHIVQEHGGRLEATSVPGCTEFITRLPAA